MTTLDKRNVVGEFLRFRLWRGDCLEKMRLIPDGSVDMVACDLPYG